MFALKAPNLTATVVATPSLFAVPPAPAKIISSSGINIAGPIHEVTAPEPPPLPPEVLGPLSPPPPPPISIIRTIDAPRGFIQDIAVLGAPLPVNEPPLPKNSW
jgi:hypothetical protein